MYELAGYGEEAWYMIDSDHEVSYCGPLKYIMRDKGLWKSIAHMVLVGVFIFV